MLSVSCSFCETCVRLAGQKCALKKHEQHSTDIIDGVNLEVEKSSPDYASPRVEQVTIGDTQEVEQLPQSLIKELLTIKEHSSSLWKKLDQICDALLRNDADAVSGELNKSRQIEEDAKKLAASISDMCERAEKLKRDQDDYIVVMHRYASGVAVKKKPTTLVRYPAFGVECVSRTLDMTCQVAMLCTNKFSLQNCSGYEGICVATENTAWLGHRGYISEFEQTGELIRKITVVNTWKDNEQTGWCTGITATDNGLLVACSDRKIHRVFQDEYGDVLAWTTIPFCPQPRGMTFLSTDCVLLCGREAGLFSVKRRGHERIDLGVDCKDIYDVAINKQGDVAVSDMDRHQVVIVNRQYKFLARYNGDPDSTKLFCPHGVTSNGDIFIVCDADNFKLHFINRDGVCLSMYQTISDRPGKQPRRVDMTPGSRLWVRFEDGSIRVYDLMLT